MRLSSFLSAVTITFFAFCSPLYAANKTPDVKEALKDWVDAVEGRSADAIANLYDNHAILISTFVEHPITKHSELVSYYKKVVANPDVNVEVVSQYPRVFGNMAVNTGEYTFSYTQDGEPVVIPARFSFTYILRDGKWVIVDHHSSRVPLPDNDR